MSVDIRSYTKKQQEVSKKKDKRGANLTPEQRRAGGINASRKAKRDQHGRFIKSSEYEGETNDTPI